VRALSESTSARKLAAPVVGQIVLAAIAWKLLESVGASSHRAGTSSLHLLLIRVQMSPLNVWPKHFDLLCGRLPLPYSSISSLLALIHRSLHILEHLMLPCILYIELGLNDRFNLNVFYWHTGYFPYIYIYIYIYMSRML
jgi:hypothetical protein